MSPSTARPAPHARPHRAGWRQRLRELPRDARDTLFLLGVVVLVLLPLAVQLPPWVSAGVLALLGWRAGLALRGARLPPRWVMAVLLAAIIGLTLWQFHTLFGRDAGVTLIAALLALKTLETRSRRDALVLFFLGFFAVAANFLFAQTLPMAVLMVAATWGLLAALVNAHLPAGRPPLRQSLATAARMMLLGTPAMVALFVLFPRFAAPLWALPKSDQRAITGLSDSLSPGGIAELARDGSVAFRVTFDGPRPPDRLLYWRGPVLSRFADGIWKPAPQLQPLDAARAPAVHAESAPVRYTVTLQPTQQPYVFALDAPLSTPRLPGATVFRLPDLQLLSARPITQLVRYTVESAPLYRYGPARLNAALRADTEWPPGWDPRTVALGHELAAQARAAGAGERAGRYVADALLRMFHDQPFRYTLDPGTYPGRSGIDQFLFDRRAGFCEHYAQAFVVVMRAAGIPARIVTGYQGGSLNPLDGTWVVRQSDAHAWAEYWLPGQGWVRADPTAAVDPARIDRSGATLADREPLLGLAALGPRDTAVLRQLRNAWDALNNGWNQWVLDYGSARQQKLLQRLGLPRLDGATLAALAIAALLATSAAIGLLLGLERRRADPWRAAFDTLRARLERAGVHSPPGTSPRALAAAVQRAAAGRAGRPAAKTASGAKPSEATTERLTPTAAQAAARLLLALEHWRYAPHPTAPDGGDAQRQWRQLQRAVRSWRPR